MADHIDHDQDPDHGPVLRFDLAFDPVFRVAGAPFGVTPGSTAVEIDDETFTARFGPWRVSTPLANVRSAEVTGPYSVPKVIGGPHLSLRDRGLTFATNARQGVCVQFREPVPGLEPTGRVRHPGLTVTVAEPAEVAELLAVAARRHGEVGEDPVPIEDLVQAEHDDLTGLSTAELRARAQARGIDGTASMKKAELVEVLSVDERDLDESRNQP